MAVGADLTAVAATLAALQLVLAPAVFFLVLRSAAQARASLGRPPEALA